MSVNSSLQQIAGGFGAVIAGNIIVQKNNFASLEHYDILAYVVSFLMLLTIYLTYKVSLLVENKGK